MIYDRYYYSLLDDIEKKVYKILYRGFERFRENIAFPINAIDICKVIDAINFDNPRLFYVCFNEIKIIERGIYSVCRPKYFFSKSQADILWKKTTEQAVKLVSAVKGADEYNKEICLHEVLATTVKYDFVAQKDSMRTPYSSTVLGVLLKNCALCEGIAKATKLLLNMLDIKCIVVCGKLKTRNDVGHAWNIVKIDGRAAHLDITSDLADPNGMPHHSYLNLTDSRILLSHAMDQPYPVCNSESNDYYVRNQLDIYDTRSIKKILKRAVQKGVRFAEFRICNPKLDEQDILELALKILTYKLLRRGVNIVSYSDKAQRTIIIHW